MTPASAQYLYKYYRESCAWRNSTMQRVFKTDKLSEPAPPPGADASRSALDEWQTRLDQWYDEALVWVRVVEPRLLADGTIGQAVGSPIPAVPTFAAAERFVMMQPPRRTWQCT